jgi:uncharacterized membrane protein
MTAASRSVLVFGVYLLALGSGLLLVPDVLLALFGQPPATDPWLRVVGLVVLVVALYYLSAARSGTEAFFRWTTWGRPMAGVALIIMIAAGLLPRFVALLAFLDLAGAAWTAAALHRAHRAGGRNGVS